MEHSNRIPLAIIGMACRLPGGDGLDQYWEMITEGRSAIDELPESRLNRRLYYDPEKGARAKTYSTLGAVLPDRPLPSESFRLSTSEVIDADPSHLALCHVLADALRHAKIDPHNVPYTQSGIYIGHTRGTGQSGDLLYGTMVDETAQWLGEVEAFRSLAGEKQQQTIQDVVRAVRAEMPHRNRRGGPNLSAHYVGRTLSRAFGFDGPYMAMNAACASSLMALSYGANALQLGHIDMAVIGGASFSKVDSLILFSKAQSVSATGSRPFDADADGLISAEGHVILLVRRLDSAIADGNPIHAVISGIGVSSDGRGKSLWAPRKEGQIAAFERAYHQQCAASSLQYVEAHATSTPVGDATEVGALAEALGPHFPTGKKIPIGSVKANIGHTLETAGLAGLVKTVLAMKHQVIPPVVNLRNLNPNIDWAGSPFYVPTNPETWPTPEQGQPRRAGVNAFGIGGLNAHVVLDEYLPTTPTNVRVPEDLSDRDESIAVIGMAAIVPGANTIKAFWDLLVSDRDPKQDVPTDRWNADRAHAPEEAIPWKTPIRRGGFITDFTYDWRKHKIPPKQIAGADPLQFMLLDAVDTALEDAGCVRGKFDGRRTGVVVGTMFGGEFAVQLQMGMRLPEFSETVKNVLRSRGAPEERLDELCEAFGDLLLERMPALNDETGSFTTSTLASRITKAFDLMGGAAAIDSGDTSGITALNLCSEMLLAGTCDLTICAAGQRSLGLPHYEQLALKGRLSLSNNPRPLSDDADGMVPGEGVGVVILKRLADAERDGDSIRCIIRGIDVARSDESQDPLAVAMSRATRRSRITPEQISVVEMGYDGTRAQRDKEMAAVEQTYGEKPSKSALAGKIGHTTGASGMLSLIKAALTVENLRLPDRQKPLDVVDDKGRVIAAVNSLGGNDSAGHVILERPGRVEVRATREPNVTAFKNEPSAFWKVIGFEAETPSELLSVVEATVRSSGKVWSHPKPLGCGAWRVTFAANGPDDLVDKATTFLKQFEHPSCKTLLPMRGIYFAEPKADEKVAFLFPGQGSQYSGMFRDVAQRHPQLRTHLAEIDSVLERLRQPSYESLVISESDRLGRDVFRTQLALLIADTLMFRAVMQLGLRPDRITGHSFGEFPALHAAGAMDFENAVLATEHRCRCIVDCHEVAGTMLSCQADEQTISDACGRLDNVYVANWNSTQQTVVGGSEAGVAKLAEMLSGQGIGTRAIDVPRPFHTPLMQEIKTPFRMALEQIVINVPMVPLLSSVHCRYVAEPDVVRDHLATQLTEPVRFVDQIRRLRSEGVSLFVEIGPRQILTRLAREILGDDGHVISTDLKNRSTEESLCRIAAQATALGFLQPYDQSATVAKLPVRHNGHSPANGKATSVSKNTDLKVAGNGKPPEHPEAVDGVPILRLEGDPYAMGLAQGRSQREAIRRTLRYYCDLSVEARKRLPDIRPALDMLEHLVTTRELEEIRGVAEGAGVSYENVLAHNLYVYPDIEGGCSQLAATPDEPHVASLLHGANEDLPLGLTLREKLVRTIQVRRPTGGLAYVTFATAGQVGGINGINSAGIAVTGAMLLDLSRRPKRTLGLLHGVVVSRILEHATDVESAIQILRSHTGCGAWGVCISHAASSQIAYVEYDGSKIRMNKTRTRLMSANHAQLLTGTCVPESHSVCRQQRLEQLWTEGASNGRISSVEAKAWLRDQMDLGRERVVRFPTMNTLLRIDNQVSLVMAPAEARCWVTKGPYGSDAPNRYVELDLERLIGLKPCRGTETPSPPVITPQPDATTTCRSTEIDVEPILSQEQYAKATNSVAGRSPRDASDKICNRFMIRLLKTPPVSDTRMRLDGRSLIIGNNELAQELAKQLHAGGNDVFVLALGDDPQSAIEVLNKQWDDGPFLHVFVTTPFDDDAITSLDLDVWQSRRQRGVMTPYFICQRWFELVQSVPVEQQRSFIACSRLGGAFTFDDSVGAVEGGAMVGLAKSLFRELRREGEAWGRTKAIDFERTVNPTEVAKHVLAEVAHQPLEREIAYRRGNRFVVRPVNIPVEEVPKQDLKITGPWVITGGGRGVTAEVARGLGLKYGGRLHLIGSSPLPQIEDAWREMNDQQLRELRSKVMREAIRQKEIPVHAWTRIEKAIEIDANLRSLESAGIQVTYHGCDVSDRRALAAVLDAVREQDGPIEAVVHGAGFEKAAKFHKKKPELVERTISAKIDGAAALMALTKNDPIKLFLAFGSISGRFGGMGQTDYCVANEMLCKLVAWYRLRRPEVAATTFDWHSWDEVGMAVRPETKYVKELSAIRYMPVAEGVEHLIHEVECGCPESETLITDWRYYKLYFPDVSADVSEDLNEDAARNVVPTLLSEDVTQRHVMRMQPESRDKMPIKLLGPAIILGNNPDALALADAIRLHGQEVTVMDVAGNTIDQSIAQMQQLCRRRFACHLFVMTGRDVGASKPLDRNHWSVRRKNGISAPFRICQEWIRQYEAVGTPEATLTAAVAMSGDFGFAQDPIAPEGGAIAGTLKSLRVESARRPWPKLNIKIVDFDAMAPENVAERVLQEAMLTDDVAEVGFRNGQRSLPHAMLQPIDTQTLQPIPAGSHWIAIGGGRGITARSAFKMAQQFNLQMHLVGSSPQPQLPTEWASLNADGRRQLKKQVTREALAAGEMPSGRWKRISKTFEIADTLRAYREAGLSVTYHSCDVTDWNVLDRTLAEIRTLGPITGIIQGAGVIHPARFEDKTAANLDVMIGVKLDATVALMDLTKDDPLKYFVGFGSISGRNGGNGNSDYALGAEMMCKLIGRFRHQRPEVCSVGFHWNAWGEVGMMVRPASFGARNVMKLALMPPAEGSRHIADELCAGGPESEVMFTTVENGQELVKPKVDTQARIDDCCLVDAVTGDAEHCDAKYRVAEMTFDPVKDPFLHEHRVKDRPILPMVMGIEAMAQAASIQCPPNHRVVRVEEVTTIEPMRLLGDAKVAARIHLTPNGRGYETRLCSDFCNRSGRLLIRDREQMTATVTTDRDECLLPAVLPPLPKSWTDVRYPAHGFIIYHGPSLQCLKQISDQVAMIDVPSDTELFGARKGDGWKTAPALLDACLYAMGIQVWRKLPNAIGLPRRLGDLRLGKMPSVGERCYASWTIRSECDDEWAFDFDLFDTTGKVVLQGRDYRATIIGSGVLK